MKNRNVAIVGATGAVGREFIGCIESRGIDVKSLKLLASARSAGKTAPFRGQNLTIEELDSHPDSVRYGRPGMKLQLLVI